MCKAGPTKQITLGLALSVVGFSLVLPNEAEASGKLTQERLALRALAQSVEFYLMDSPSNSLTRWSDLSRYFQINEINETRLRGKRCYPLQAHYAFVTQYVAMPAPYEGRLFIVGTSPIRRPGGGWFASKGRYAIHGGTNDVSESWLDEKTLNNLLANVQPPTPDLTSVPLPPGAMRRTPIVPLLVLFLLVGGALYVFLRFKRIRP